MNKQIYYLSDHEANLLMTQLEAVSRRHISTSDTDKLFDGYHNIATFTVVADGVRIELMRA